MSKITLRVTCNFPVLVDSNDYLDEHGEQLRTPDIAAVVAARLTQGDLSIGKILGDAIVGRELNFAVVPE